MRRETTPQGLISIEDRGDHIFIHLLESAVSNRGKNKLFLGVPGNLMAFACKMSFDLGYQGVVCFISKTKLMSHYQKIAGAEILFGNTMVIENPAAKRLVKKYFPKNCKLKYDKRAQRRRLDHWWQAAHLRRFPPYQRMDQE